MGTKTLKGSVGGIEEKYRAHGNVLAVNLKSNYDYDSTIYLFERFKFTVTVPQMNQSFTESFYTSLLAAILPHAELS